MKRLSTHDNQLVSLNKLVLKKTIQHTCTKTFPSTVQFCKSLKKAKGLPKDYMNLLLTAFYCKSAAFSSGSSSCLCNPIY